MDESYRYKRGTDATDDEAIYAAKEVVDASLNSLYKEGLTVDKLYDLYRSFGEDAFIVSKDKDCGFSAWTYAQNQCEELCSQSFQPAPAKP